MDVEDVLLFHRFSDKFFPCLYFATSNEQIVTSHLTWKSPENHGDLIADSLRRSNVYYDC